MTKHEDTAPLSGVGSSDVLGILLPCPFCGCRTIKAKTRKTTIVGCVACPAMVITRDREASITAWNKRTSIGSVEYVSVLADLKVRREAIEKVITAIESYFVPN